MLLHLLRDKDEFVRNPVMYALMELPPDKALWNGVKELLQDDDSGVRSSGGRLLLHLGREAGAEAVPVVIELLQGEDTNVRTEAINILLHLGPDAAPAVPVLVKMLKKEWPLRYYAARALAGIGPEAQSAAPDLVLMLKDNDELCRETAAAALREIDPEAAGRAGVK